DGLLSFDARQLCAYFSRFPNCSSPIQGWEVVPDPPQDGRVNAAAAGPLDLTKMIRSNYLEE
ncbi:MAG: hypothetical protein ACE5GN_04010, partial [Waddliaceae bacterium]